jgi:hypothetical protein
MFRRIMALGFVALAACAALAAADPTPKTSSTRAATPDELVLLTEALEKTAGDLRRWAYTESRVIRDEKGKVKSETLVRYDPSKPWAEQWTPISINQKPPTAKDVEKYRKMGLRAQKISEHPETDKRRTLGESIELHKSRVASETAGQIVFEVPLKKGDNMRFPPEKFEVLVRINQPTRALENIAVRLRSSFRAKLVVNVKKGGGTLEFGVVNPKYPPTLLSISGDASASVFFVSVGGELDLKRTELKHVKPFDERFDVQIGTLKAIDF